LLTWSEAAMPHRINTATAPQRVFVSSGISQPCAETRLYSNPK
jgi:hypothetical protein